MGMIAELSINNLVLADRLQLQLHHGLVALTGETGAGKSLVGQALGLACGGRTKAGLVRRGEDSARVEMALEFDGNARGAVDEELKSFGLPLSEEGRVVLRRELTNDGKSRSWINGVAVSLRTLSSLWSERLRRIDQGAAAQLALPDKRLALIDRALPASNRLKEMAKAAMVWRRAADRLAELKEELQRNQDQRELLRHWCQEMESFAPEEGEWDELVATRKKAREQREQRAALLRAERVIGGDRGMLQALNELRRIAISSPNPDPLHDWAAKADHGIDNFLRCLQDQASDLIEVDLDSLQERLFRWRDLARKHRCNEVELPAHLVQIQAQLARLDAPEDALKAAQSLAASSRTAAETLAQALSEARGKAAAKLERKLNKLLPELGFSGAAIEIEIKRAEGLTRLGWDRAEFHFQANPGEGFAPLEKSASGGEKARLLLALDCSLPRRDLLTSVFYDEIDAGMGGRAAQAVAKLLQSQGKQVQVLVVSHQAAVAATAEQHICVTKSTVKGRTFLSLNSLTGKAREAELARMTSGDVAPDAAAEVARALLDEGQSHAPL
jgi:DNA repair protein RecN (Recombination protein N)